MTEMVRSLYAKWYGKNKKAYGFLYAHSVAVSDFALPVAERLGLDVAFVREGALLHDIGIIKTQAPSIGCTGDEHYIRHGVLGAEMLRSVGLETLAVVCETHVGVAITAEDIVSQKLPLPHRDMVPQSDEEKLIAYADMFFSKRPEYLTSAKPVSLILKEIARFGERPVTIFKEWHKKFTGEVL